MHDYPREITKMIRGYGDNTQKNLSMYWKFECFISPTYVYFCTLL